MRLSQAFDTISGSLPALFITVEASLVARSTPDAAGNHQHRGLADRRSAAKMDNRPFHLKGAQERRSHGGRQSEYRPAIAYGRLCHTLLPVFERAAATDGWPDLRGALINDLISTAQRAIRQHKAFAVPAE